MSNCEKGSFLLNKFSKQNDVIELLLTQLGLVDCKKS